MAKKKATESPPKGRASAPAIEDCRACPHFGFYSAIREAYCLHKSTKVVVPDGSSRVGLPRKFAAEKCPLSGAGVPGGAGVPACDQEEPAQ